MIQGVSNENYSDDFIPKAVTVTYCSHVRQVITCNKIAYVHEPNEKFHIDYEMTLNLINGNKEKEHA